MTETPSDCCDWLQTAHLSHWLSRRQAGSFNFQVISLRGCVILSYFYHTDPICMMQRDDTVQTDGVAKFLLQRVFNNYSSGHKWNTFIQSSNTLTAYNDLCPECEDLCVIVTSFCSHVEKQDWMMTSLSQSSGRVHIWIKAPDWFGISCCWAHLLTKNRKKFIFTQNRLLKTNCKCSWIHTAELAYCNSSVPPVPCSVRLWSTTAALYVYVSCGSPDSSVEDKQDFCCCWVPELQQSNSAVFSTEQTGSQSWKQQH